MKKRIVLPLALASILAFNIPTFNTTVLAATEKTTASKDEILEYAKQYRHMSSRIMKLCDKFGLSTSEAKAVYAELDRLEEEENKKLTTTQTTTQTTTEKPTETTTIKQITTERPTETTTIKQTTTERPTETTTKVAQNNNAGSNSNTQKRVVKVRIGSKNATVDGKSEVMDVAPYISNGNTMIPLRFVANALGINDNAIEYDVNTKIIRIIHKGKELYFKPNEKEIVIIQGTNKEVKIMDNNAKAEINNSRTFIPFRPLSEVFGLEMQWEANTKTAIMTDNSSIGSTNNNNNNNNNNSNQGGNNNSNNIDVNSLEYLNDNNRNYMNLTEKQLRVLEEEVVRLTNIEREKAGLEPLIIDETLMEVSRFRSKDMVDNDYFSHTSPTYGAWHETLKEYGVESMAAGENIVLHSKPQQAVNMWMGSEGHRENILNPNFKRIGIGYTETPNDIRNDAVYTMILTD